MNKRPDILKYTNWFRYYEFKEDKLINLVIYVANIITLTEYE